MASNSLFTTFLRLVPSDVAAAMGVVSLMEQFNWSRLGIITQQESTFVFVSFICTIIKIDVLCQQVLHIIIIIIIIHISSN